MLARLVCLITASLLLVSGAVPLAHASSGSTESRRAGADKLRFNFDNGESLRPGTRVRNVAGKGSGVVLIFQGGRLKGVKGERGKAAKFPSRCNGCGRALIEVTDRRALDPRLRQLKFGVDVRMTRVQRAAPHANLIQKGYYNQPGGQYKLQLDAGRPSCVINGSAGRVKVFAERRIRVNRWRSITCQRVASTVVLRVDGRVWASAVGDTGLIANAAAVRVGAKRLDVPKADQYRGLLDNVFIRVTR